MTDIIPIIAERSEKKAVNHGRLVKISVEASEQSGRGDVPTIHPVVSLKEAVRVRRTGYEVRRREKSEILKSEILNKSDQPIGGQNSNIKAIAFHTDGELFDQKDYSKDEAIAILIGPEGGWSLDEIDMFHKNDIEVRCLGSKTLRAETAVVVALSRLLL